jgi:hypothetical protein
MFPALLKATKIVQWIDGSKKNRKKWDYAAQMYSQF